MSETTSTDRYAFHTDETFVNQAGKIHMVIAISSGGYVPFHEMEFDSLENAKVFAAGLNKDHLGLTEDQALDVVIESMAASLGAAE